MGLYLSYDNKSLQDGFGAQLLRILGIYSIAKFFRLKYIHEPILATIEEFAHNVSGLTELDQLIHQVNDFFSLPSDKSPVKFDEVISIRSLDFRVFLRYLVRCKFRKKNTLLRVLLPFPLIDRLPEIYRIACREIVSKNQDVFAHHHRLNWVLHIRLGYGQLTKIPDAVSPRFLPIKYYVQLLENVLYLENPNIDNVVIHTDLPGSSRLWRPTPKRLQQNIEFGESMIDGELHVEPFDLNVFFSRLDKLKYEIKNCKPFIETFLDMANADYLVMSRSSLSYLAGLFSEGKVVWPENHGHAKLFKWISSERYNVQMDFELLRG